MVNTHKDVFAQLAMASPKSISPTITCKLAVLAEADTVECSEMEEIVEECTCLHLASDIAVNALNVVLFSLKREELEYCQPNLRTAAGGL